MHGRHSTPVEVILRLLIVKHLHQWSYQETEEQVDQNLILRWFCRLYWTPVPDDTTLIRWANTLRPETLHALNGPVVQLSLQPFGKRVQIRDATAKSRLQPGIKLIWLTLPHHRAKALRQVVGDLNRGFLTDEGQQEDQQPVQRTSPAGDLLLEQ